MKPAGVRTWLAQTTLNHSEALAPGSNCLAVHDGQGIAALKPFTANFRRGLLLQNDVEPSLQDCRLHFGAFDESVSTLTALTFLK